MREHYTWSKFIECTGWA